jgi:predicted nuclease of predicted toxin-antitoxin system
VRFLIDECLNLRVTTLLKEAGHDAIHVTEVGLAGHPHVEVMALARAERRVLVSADTDFGELLVNSGDTMPSVILLRRNHDVANQAAVILTALPDIEEQLRQGAFVVITVDRVRIRSLPFD